MGSCHSHSIRLCISAIVLTAGFAASGEAIAQARSFNIPSGPLAHALQNFARASHRQIIFSNEIVRGRVSRSLVGAYSDEAALAKLLEGTGLTVRISKSGAIMINDAKSGETARPASMIANSGVDEGQSPDIIVTANKRNERQRDIAGSVDVVTTNLMNETSANQLSDYADFIPGLTLQTSGAPGRSLVAIRGLTTGPNQTGASVGTYIDDVPFGSSTAFAEGGRQTPDIDPSQIQQIEILKGPQGTLYGASSLGGVIKYDTVPPSLTTASAGLSEELNGVQGGGLGYTLRARGNVPILEEKIGISVGGFYRKDPGFTNTTDLAGNVHKNVNENVIYGFNGAILLKPTERLTIRLNGLYARSLADGYNEVMVNSVTMKPQYGKYTAFVRYPQESYIQYDLLSATVSYDLGGATLTSSTGYSNLRDRITVDYKDFGTALGLPATNKFDGNNQDHTRKVSEELRLASNPGQRLDWIIGGFFTHERSVALQHIFAYDNNEALLPSPDFNLYDQTVVVTYTEFAGFGDLTYHASPNLDATIGVRYSKNHQEFDRERSGLIVLPATPLKMLVYPHVKSTDDNITYLFAARWRFAPDNLLYVRAASGYRPGGPISLPPTAVVPAGYPTAFKPDTVWNYEIGYRTDLLDKKLSIDATAFYIDWKNIQSLVFFSPFFVYGTGGNAVSKGFELQANYKPSPRLSLNGTVGYTDAHMTKVAPSFTAAVAGERLPYVPRWKASLLGSYTFPLGNDWQGVIGGNVRYMSSRVTDFSQSGDNLKFAGYVQEDFNLSAKRDGFEVQFFIKNVSNKFGYTSVVNYVLGNPGEPGLSIIQPRTFGLKLTQAFN
jgi:iron complex outermembrane recepter protein